MGRRIASLLAATVIGCTISAAQDSTLYLWEDPLETEVYVFYRDHTFKHYSRSLGKFYCGSGKWYDEKKVRTVSFGGHDTTITMGDAAWTHIDTVGVFLAPLNLEVSPTQHFLKIKKDKLMFYDYRYSFSERLRGEKAGYLIRQP
jgi:hypothetical protein